MSNLALIRPLRAIYNALAQLVHATERVTLGRNDSFVQAYNIQSCHCRILLGQIYNLLQDTEDLYLQIGHDQTEFRHCNAVPYTKRTPKSIFSLFTPTTTLLCTVG